jgi:hypothetical protein
VRPAHLGNGHLEILEGVVLIALLEGADQEFMGKDVLLGEAGGRDGLEAGEEFLVGGVVTVGFGQGDVVQLVVVAIIAVRGRGLRRGFQVRLILLFKERILRGNARCREAWRPERLQ